MAYNKVPILSYLKEHIFTYKLTYVKMLGIKRLKTKTTMLRIHIIKR